ncbi:MAG: hypothetical protein NVS3B26_14530 [Mycobacteriales bacterium]
MSAALLVVYTAVGVAVVVAIGLSFFLRRHGESGIADGNWQATQETFVDPTTSRRMRVWLDRVDGTRHYVADP